MTNQIYIQYYKSPAGELILGSYNDSLCLCDWRYRKTRHKIDQRILKGLDAGFFEKKSPVTNLAIIQLGEYFRGERKLFDLPLLMTGTGFQKQVWEELTGIPYGSTETYLGLSKKLHNQNGIRAVAAANGANALAIIVPCHRIIGSSGELTGYAGGLEAKRKLLLLEQRHDKVNHKEPSLPFDFED